MSTLIIQLPARVRLRADAEQDAAGTLPGATAREFAYVLSGDGVSVTRQGRCVAPMLPRADNVVAVMPPQDLSWHRLTLPRAPAGRLRAALASLLEEALLDEPDDVHLAVAPAARPGQPTWVAVCDHTWLTGQIMALEKAKVRVDRVVPAVWPDEPASAYFHQLDGDPDGGESSDTVITWSSAEGVATWPADGSLARALLPDPAPDDARWFATPAVAAPAERWLGRPVIVQTPAEHMLQAARSLWNLLQFELTPRSKGLHALRDQWRRLMSPQWRPVRAGLAALVAVQVLGLNLWAWHEKRDVQRQRSEMVQLLRQAHPQVQVVLDAPVQMQKETELLRAAAGEPGDNDLESLMGAVAAVWPAEQASPSLQYDGNSLTLGAPAGWGAPEIEALRERLLAAGVELEVDPAGGRFTVRRVPRA